MNTETETLRTDELSATELAKACPPGWNVYEYKNRYAHAGFAHVRKLFREAAREIGDGAIPADKLPLPCEVPVELRGVDQNGVVVAGDAEGADAAIGNLGALTSEDHGRCRGPSDAPDLTGAYLKAHRAIDWDYRDMKDVYAAIGYAAARKAMEMTLAEGEPVSFPRRVMVPFTLGTTRLGGGCAMICVNNFCSHVPDDSSNAPGGG